MSAKNTLHIYGIISKSLVATLFAALAELRELFAEHGRDTTAFHLLLPSTRVWRGADGAIGFAEASGAWVTASGPLCAPDQAAVCVDAFCETAREAGRRVRFFAAEEGFPVGTQFARIKIGEQPIWDPSQWPSTLARSRSLREQLRRARAKGVEVSRLSVDEVTRDAEQLRGLQRRWLASRKMAPMGFLVDLHPLHELPMRRTFVATWQGRCVAMFTLAPIPARNGWLLEHLLREPSAPNGTAELLFDTAMRAVAAEGARHVTFGMAPLAGVSSRSLRVIRALATPLYDFHGLHAFKQKLCPAHWEPLYLVFPRSELGLLAIVDTLRVFARGSFVRFGLTSALHLLRRGLVFASTRRISGKKTRHR